MHCFKINLILNCTILKKFTLILLLFILFYLEYNFFIFNSIMHGHIKNSHAVMGQLYVFFYLEQWRAGTVELLSWQHAFCIACVQPGQCYLLRLRASNTVALKR